MHPGQGCVIKRHVDYMIIRLNPQMTKGRHVDEVKWKDRKRDCMVLYTRCVFLLSRIYPCPSGGWGGRDKLVYSCTSIPLLPCSPCSLVADRSVGASIAFSLRWGSVLLASMMLACWLAWCGGLGLGSVWFYVSARMWTCTCRVCGSVLDLYGAFGSYHVGVESYWWGF